jgi:centromeric protein E
MILCHAVAIRMRPLNNPQEEGNSRRVWRVLPKYAAITQTTPQGHPLPEKVVGRTFFQYDQVFGEDSTTLNVYEKVAQPIVSSVVQGLNGTIFAYGQTSSGKTYTMQGAGAGTVDFHQHGGIFHMAASDIFAHVKSNPDRLFLVRASFLEIYNEEVRDLLVSTGKGGSNAVLQIREDPRRGVFVQSREEIVTDFDSLLSVMLEGEKSRTFAATAMNERSSRSHTIFRVTIESRKKPDETQNKSLNEDSDEMENHDGEDNTVLISTLNLVDLAGSESVRHTGATGDRQKEGGMINIR